MGVRVARSPALDNHLEIARLSVRRQLGERDQADGRLDAKGGQLLGNRLCEGRIVGEFRRHGDLVFHAFAVRADPHAVRTLLVPRTSHESLGAGRVVLVTVQLRDGIRRHPLGDEPVGEPGHVLRGLSRLTQRRRCTNLTLDGVGNCLTDCLGGDRRHLGVVEEKGGSSVCRRTQDAEPQILERPFGCRREPVGRVVDFLGQDDGGDGRRLAVVEDHRVKPDGGRCPARGNLGQGQLCLGHAPRIDRERTRRDHGFGTELAEVLAKGLPLVRVSGLASIDQVADLVRPRAVGGTGPDLGTQHIALDDGRGLAHDEVDRVVIRRLDAVDVAPDDIVEQLLEKERIDHVLRSECTAVAPLRTLAKLHLEHVAIRHGLPRRRHQRHPAALGPVVHAQRHLQQVPIDPGPDEAGRECVVVPRRRQVVRVRPVEGLATAHAVLGQCGRRNRPRGRSKNRADETDGLPTTHPA